MISKLHFRDTPSPIDELQPKLFMILPNLEYSQISLKTYFRGILSILLQISKPMLHSKHPQGRPRRSVYPPCREGGRGTTFRQQCWHCLQPVTSVMFLSYLFSLYKSTRPPISRSPMYRPEPPLCGFSHGPWDPSGFYIPPQVDNWLRKHPIL